MNWKMMIVMLAIAQSGFSAESGGTTGGEAPTKRDKRKGNAEAMSADGSVGTIVGGIFENEHEEKFIVILDDDGKSEKVFRVVSPSESLIRLPNQSQ